MARVHKQGSLANRLNPICSVVHFCSREMLLGSSAAFKRTVSILHPRPKNVNTRYNRTTSARRSQLSNQFLRPSVSVSAGDLQLENSFYVPRRLRCFFLVSGMYLGMWWLICIGRDWIKVENLPGYPLGRCFRRWPSIVQHHVQHLKHLIALSTTMCSCLLGEKASGDPKTCHSCDYT